MGSMEPHLFSKKTKVTPVFHLFLQKIEILLQLFYDSITPIERTNEPNKLNENDEIIQSYSTLPGL